MKYECGSLICSFSSKDKRRLPYSSDLLKPGTTVRAGSKTICADCYQLGLVDRRVEVLKPATRSQPPALVIAARTSKQSEADSLLRSSALEPPVISSSEPWQLEDVTSDEEEEDEQVYIRNKETSGGGIGETRKASPKVDCKSDDGAMADDDELPPDTLLRDLPDLRSEEKSDALKRQQSPEFDDEHETKDEDEVLQDFKEEPLVVSPPPSPKAPRKAGLGGDTFVGQTKGQVREVVEKWLHENNVAVGNGKQHGRAATESPDMVPALLAKVRELKTSLEETRELYRKLEHARAIFKANKMEDYFDLLIETTLNGKAPPNHLFWLTLSDKLKNNCRDHNGFRFCEEIKKLCALVRPAQSGHTALEFLAGYNSGAAIPNLCEIPSAKYLREWTRDQHADPGFRAGVSCPVIRALFERAQAQRPPEADPYSAANPLQVAFSFDDTDANPRQGFAHDGQFTGDELMPVIGDNEETTEVLQTKFLGFKRFLDAACPRGNVGSTPQDKRDISGILDFLSEHEDALKRHVVDKSVYAQDKEEYYIAKNESKGKAAEAHGLQKYFLTKFEQAQLAAQRSVAALESMRDILQRGQISASECNLVFELLKDVVLELRICAKKFFLGLLTLLNGGYAASTIRLYHQSMSAAQVAEVVALVCKEVSSATEGCAVVAVIAYDGEHRKLRQGTADAFAAKAKEHVNDILTRGGDAFKGSSSDADAQKTVSLSRFIFDNISFQAQHPNIVGAFLAKPMARRHARSSSDDGDGDDSNDDDDKNDDGCDHHDGEACDDDDNFDDPAAGYLKGRQFSRDFGGETYTADVAAFWLNTKSYLVVYSDGEKDECDAAEIEALLAAMPGEAPIVDLSSSSRCTLSSAIYGSRFVEAVLSSDPPIPVQDILQRRQPLPPTPSFSNGATDFSSMYGPFCHSESMPQRMVDKLKKLNAAIPCPLLRPNEETVPQSALIGADKKERLPQYLLRKMLSVKQRGQLVTLFRNYQAAFNFILFRSAQRHCKSVGLKALRELPIKVLSKFLEDNGRLSMVPRRERKNGVKLYERVLLLANEARWANEIIALELVGGLVDSNLDGGRQEVSNMIHSRISGFLFINGMDDLLAMLILDEALDEPMRMFFAREIRQKVLLAAAVNIALSCVQSKASTEGGLYHVEAGQPVHLIDFSHLHHNLWQSLVKQKLVTNGTGRGAGQSVLPLARLLEAAIQTGDKILINGLQGNCDIHSHTMSRAVLTSKSLVRELVKLDYMREAVIMEIIGDSVEAWHVPHQTEALRSEALHMVSILVYRLFGDGLRNAQCLGRQFFGGLPCKQWLDLVYNADARRMLLCATPWPHRQAVVESSLGTGGCESHFASEASCSTSGHKADVQTIQQRTIQLDVAAQFKLEAQQDEHGAFGARMSKRQRKDGAAKKNDWNDGTRERGAYDKDLQTRARQHNGGHNNHSTRDFVKNRTGF